MERETVDQYLNKHTTPHSKIVEELISAADKDLNHIDMLSGIQVARLLSMLIKTSGAKRVLEIGTFVGYSALMMAEALPDDGELLSCEYNERYKNLAQSFFKKSDVGHKINLVMGKALETIPSIAGSFDFVFMDADKINYPNYYKLIVSRLDKGGLLVADNVLWGGEVLNPEGDKAQAIHEMNEYIANDDNVEQVMLPVRDGITIVRKK